MEKRVVRSVKRIGVTEKVVYNIATKNRNYFANGVLVHNCDDPNNPEKVESDAIRESTLKRYKDYSIGRRNDPKNTAIVIIQQRTHESDISGYVLAEDADKFTTVILPTVAEKDETIVFPKSGKIVKRSRGELLHPERFGEEEVAEAKKTLGAYMYAGRHQQRPIPREGGILKEQYWQYYLAPPPCPIKVVAWDTAQEAKNHNDYSAGVLMGTWNNNYYVLDVFQGRLEFPELKRRISALYERDRPNAVIIEQKSSGHSLLQALRRDTTLPLIAQKVDRDKIARVEAISPTVEAGRVFLPHNAPWLADFIAETAGFPNAAHDDQCFVAGTKIATLFGDKNIENIKQGDLLVSPYGLSKVKISKMTGRSRVITKFGLTGTPNHPIYTENKGFVKLDALTHAFELNQLSLWEILRWSVQKRSYLTGLFTGEWELKEDITCRSQQKTQKGKEQKGFTWLYTSITVGRQCKKGIMSTIKMAIRLTIALTIWSVYQLTNTIKSPKISTWKSNLSTWTASGIWQVLGMDRQRESSGTKNTERGRGKTENIKNIAVLSVKKNSSLEIREGLNFVAQNAPITIKEKQVSTTKNQFAKVATKNLLLLGDGEEVTQKPALLNAGNLLQEEEEENREVYNLMVEGGVYYANGVLVHNCDAFVFALNYLVKGSSSFSATATGRKRSSSGLKY